MDDLQLIVAGAITGIAAWMAYRYLTRGPQIDPSTGGVELAPGETYGPPAPFVGGLQ